MNKNNVTCTLCKSSETEVIPNKIRNNDNPEIKMYRCHHCETHFMWPLPAAETLEHYYNGEFRSEVHTETYYDTEKLSEVFRTFSTEANHRVNRVKRELSPTDDILEIGCSVGYFLYAIKPHVKLAYGVELDSKARNYIETVLNNPAIKTKKSPYDFNMKFDKIFLYHVLEHIEDPIAYLTDLKQLLKEGGKIYIEVPNVDDVMIKTYHSDAFLDYYYKKAHLYNFNEKGLSYLFEKAGFNYQFRFLQRYPITNHFHWLAKHSPSGFGGFSHLYSETLTLEYARVLRECKQTDTVFAIISEQNS